ncbi:hypothetical protein BJ742DRAFT_830140 [Cladochytrium replicatum]|nr:hypothetical protein BJ742DRAFT_830140 [Cladochytrium replicatum]
MEDKLDAGKEGSTHISSGLAFEGTVVSGGHIIDDPTFEGFDYVASDTDEAEPEIVELSRAYYDIRPSSGAIELKRFERPISAKETIESLDPLFLPILGDSLVTETIDAALAKSADGYLSIEMAIDCLEISSISNKMVSPWKLTNMTQSSSSSMTEYTTIDSAVFELEPDLHIGDRSASTMSVSTQVSSAMPLDGGSKADAYSNASPCIVSNGTAQCADPNNQSTSLKAKVDSDQVSEEKETSDSKSNPMTCPGGAPKPITKIEISAGRLSNAVTPSSRSFPAQIDLSDSNLPILVSFGNIDHGLTKSSPCTGAILSDASGIDSQLPVPIRNPKNYALSGSTNAAQNKTETNDEAQIAQENTKARDGGKNAAIDVPNHARGQVVASALPWTNSTKSPESQSSWNAKRGKRITVLTSRGLGLEVQEDQVPPSGDELSLVLPTKHNNLRSPDTGTVTVASTGPNSSVLVSGQSEVQTGPKLPCLESKSITARLSRSQTPHSVELLTDDCIHRTLLHHPKAHKLLRMEFPHLQTPPPHPADEQCREHRFSPHSLPLPIVRENRAMPAPVVQMLRPLRVKELRVKRELELQACYLGPTSPVSKMFLERKHVRAVSRLLQPHGSSDTVDTGAAKKKELVVNEQWRRIMKFDAEPLTPTFNLKTSPTTTYRVLNSPLSETLKSFPSKNKDQTIQKEGSNEEELRDQRKMSKSKRSSVAVERYRTLQSKAREERRIGQPQFVLTTFKPMH